MTQPHSYSLVPCEGALALTNDRPHFTVIEGGRKAARKQAQGSGMLFVTALVSIVIFVAVWILMDNALQARIDSAFAKANYETVTVVSGDSLWSIAEEHPVKGCSTQQVVNHIRVTNNLDSALLPAGERLVVPVAG